MRYLSLLLKHSGFTFYSLYGKVFNKYKVSIYNTFGFRRSVFLNIPVELFIDLIPRPSKSKRRILLLLEPDEISGIKKNVLESDTDHFDLILTHDPEILQKFSHAKLFLFGTTWVKDFDFKDKVFGVSSLIGGKTITPLHQLRHRLPELLDLDVKIKMFFFNSINSAFNSQDNRLLNIKSKHSKNELFIWQYHIVIENVISENWFTEKLLDCFQTKTIPIYLGCPNIGSFFDLSGMFIVRSFSDIIAVLETLKEDTYEQMLQSINYNYEKSHDYADFGKRVEDELRYFDQEWAKN